MESKGNGVVEYSSSESRVIFKDAKVIDVVAYNPNREAVRAASTYKQIESAHNQTIGGIDLNI